MFLLVVACKNDQPINTEGASKNAAHKVKTSKPRTYKVKNIGDTLDVFNDVYVLYNKSMNNTSGRHLAKDGYNIGLKWQCVEFVKRYYYEKLNHKMPNSYGHAKDFFNVALKDNQKNKDRNLMQFTNGSMLSPKVNDLLIFNGNLFNPYGHVAIISKVNTNSIEVVQQNVGKKSREEFKLINKNGKWTIDDSGILGWLRKP